MSLALTKEAIAAYLENPDHCPYCGSYDISITDTTEYVYSIKCRDCDREWEEILQIETIVAQDYFFDEEEENEDDNDEDPEESDEKLCDKCRRNPAESLHYCPYQNDMRGNNDPAYCNCCDSCRSSCLGDI